MSIFYFPVGITPTKPLTPTHVKGLLHLDGLVRLHRRCEPVCLVHNRRLWDLSRQTLQFWSWLDQEHSATAFSTLSDDAVGSLYVQWASSPRQPEATKVHELWRRVQRDGYVHPASESMLRHWIPQLQCIGVDTQVLQQSHRPTSTEDELLDVLGQQSVLIDHRPVGGGLYIDLTEHGHGVRQLVSEDGMRNYMMGMLQEALTVARPGHTIHLFHDASVERDFLLMESLLKRLGCTVTRVSFPRVTVNGQALSFREGGGFHTLSGMLERMSGRHEQRVMRLALRILLLQMQGIRKPFDFHWEQLDQACMLAQSVTDTLAPVASMSPSEATSLWQSLRRKDGTMNLHAALTWLMSPRTPSNKRATLLECLVDDTPFAA